MQRSNSTTATRMTEPDRTLSVAPMMEWTDRHERYFLRLLSRRTLLYTEMVTTGALLHGDAARHLRFDAAERPVALQLGGADPAALADCAAMGAAWGYDEINLNVGCPSDRVQAARFGACLMAEPALVRDCVAAMRAATGKPVTVKSRIGVDDRDSYEDLRDFVARVADGGCEVFIVHARKALLSGLSPKQNREIPPLHYEFVYRIKREFPHLTVILNGGVASLDAAAEHSKRVDGVMVGRAAYRDPWLLAEADSRFFGARDPLATRRDAAIGFLPYVAARLSEGVPLHAMTRHILGLFNGCRGARQWRRFLSENAHRDGAGIEVVESALTFVEPDDTVRRAAAI
jgi:tRNA-dihydrouridine synthase A